jgi:hypothetical protein
MPPDVWVVRRKDVPRCFLQLPATLAADEMHLIQRVAGRPSTWRASVPAPLG